MKEQLLWVETVLKFCGGLAFLLTPLSVARAFGLAYTPTAFWIRLFGAVLVGLAAALYLEGASKSGEGLGLAGVLTINLVTATAISLMLVAQNAAPRKRGRIALWLLVAILGVISIVEIICLAAT